MRCQNCGFQFPIGPKACPNCGRPVMASGANRPPYQTNGGNMPKVPAQGGPAVDMPQDDPRAQMAQGQSFMGNPMPTKQVAGGQDGISSAVQPAYGNLGNGPAPNGPIQTPYMERPVMQETAYDPYRNTEGTSGDAMPKMAGQGYHQDCGSPWDRPEPQPRGSLVGQQQKNTLDYGGAQEPSYNKQSAGYPMQETFQAGPLQYGMAQEKPGHGYPDDYHSRKPEQIPDVIRGNTEKYPVNGDANKESPKTARDQPPLQAQPGGGQQEGNGFGVASLIMGLASFIVVPIVTSILAIAFANISVKRAGKNGLAKAGKVLGIISLVVYACLVAVYIMVLAGAISLL